MSSPFPLFIVIYETIWNSALKNHGKHVSLIKNADLVLLLAPEPESNKQDQFWVSQQ